MGKTRTESQLMWNLHEKGFTRLLMVLKRPDILDVRILGDTEKVLKLVVEYVDFYWCRSATQPGSI